MRNLISFAVVCLVFLPATGVRAEVFPGGSGGRGGDVGGEGPERGREKPMVTIDMTRTSGDPQMPDSIFTLTFEFSVVVTGFTTDDVRVTGAEKISDVMEQQSGTEYSLDIKTNSGLEGDIVVTVRANAVENDGDGNDEATFDFPVDNKAPELEQATANLQTIVLRYHEELDEQYQAHGNDFRVTTNRPDGTTGINNGITSAVDVEDAVVTITLFDNDTIHAGDTVKLTYTHGSNGLRDEKGNYIPAFEDLKVENLRDLDAPGSVQNLTATGISTDTIKLDWELPADVGGSAVIGYRILGSDDGGNNYQVLRSSTVNEEADTITEHIHDGLQPGETWHYLVSAINSTGEGTITGVSGQTKREGEVPGAPTELTAEADGNTAIDLDWDAPADPGSSAITGYRIEVSTDGGSNWTDLVTTTNTFYEHSGLQPDTTLHYRVWARNDTGESDNPSNLANATTTTVTSAPDPPTGLTATAQGQDQIDLSWTAPSDDGGSPITGYKIEMSDDGTTGWTDLEDNTGSAETTYSDNTVTAGTTRHYQVSAINAVGTGNPSNVDDATTEGSLPGRPTGLTATAQDTSQIDLAWTAPTDDGGAAISGYQIEYRSDAGSIWRVLVANTDNTDNNYTDSGLERGTTRHYRVSAINAVGTGNPSNVATETTRDAPGSPTNLTATPNGQTQIDLSWTEPASNGGSPITGYQIEVSANRGATWTMLVENSQSTATTYPHEGLTAGTTRHYQVSAINAIGTGPASSVDHATTVAAVPDAPTNLTATASGRTRIDLDWDKPPSDGGSPIIGYRIQMSEDAGVTWSTLVSDTERTATSYAHRGLSAGTTRHYRVRALNAEGEGAESNVDSATTAPDVPDAPTGLNAVAAGTSRIDLSWSEPANDNGSAVTGYKIEVSNTGNSGWSVHEANTNTTARDYSHTGLNPDTTLYYRVSAINEEGTGPSSNVDHATIYATVPGAPTGLEAMANVANGSSQIDLSWTAPTYDGGSPVTGYQVEVSEDGGSQWEELEANTSSTAAKYSHTGLNPDTTLYYRVSAINEEGTGPSSNVDDATTDATVPGAPTGLEAMAKGSSQIDLSWTAPTYDGGSPVTGYQVEVSEDGESQWEELEANTSSTAAKYSHTGLNPDTTLYYRVSAINEEGTGPSSNVDDATTDATVPGASTDLEAMAKGSSQIDLSWTAPTYDGGSPVTGYQVEVSEDGESQWEELEANTSSTAAKYSHTGLTPDTTLYYRVSAINEEGTGPSSNVDDATTDATVPGAPTDLEAMANGSSRIDLSWTAPDYDGGAAVTGYHIEVSLGRGLAWRDLVANTNSTATYYAHTGLSPATTRHYRVSAINRVGPGDPSNVEQATTDATVPNAPARLSATAKDHSQIDLDWAAPDFDGGSAVTGYRIEVSENEGSTWTNLVANTGSTTTAYSHTDLAPATTRHYRVSAINAIGTGEASEVESATTDATTPDAPTDLAAIANGTSRIDLAWTAPDYDGGAAVTGYHIEVSLGRGLAWRDLVANTNSTATYYAHTGLSPATTRHYRVSAINRVGPGDPSNVEQATTDATVPNAPARLSATAKDHSQIDLDWAAPDFDGGSAVTGYRIEVSENEGSTWTNLVANTGSTTTAYSHTDLAPATTRHYRVSAINAIGTGEASEVESATTDATTPDAPTDLAAIANGTSRIDLAWTAPDYDGGAAVTGYHIEVSLDRGLAWRDLVANTNSTATYYAHTGLSPATTRHYRVSAINRVGPGDPSNVEQATTDATVPNAPARLSATAKDHSQIDLDWAAPDFDGGSAVTGYRIEVSENEGSTWTNLVANTGSTTTAYSHTDLAPATTRHYRVSAINAIGTGNPSNMANATTDAIAPNPPTNLVATATAPTRIDLTWSAPAYDGGAPITSYRIEVSLDGINWTDLQRSTGVSLTSYAHIGLRPGSTRHYRVSAINVAGTGLPSGVASASTDDPVERAGRVNEAVLPHFAAAMTTSTLSAIAGRIESVASRNPLGSQLSAAGLLSQAGNMGLRGSAGGLDMARLFNGASFALPLGGDGQDQEGSRPPGITTWGSAEYTSMGEPTGEEIEWEGDMLSIHVGADMRVHRDFLAGVAGTRSSGNYDFTDVTGEREVEGTYEARMTSLNPYLAWLPGRKGVSLWAAGSFGWGEVAVDDQPGGRRASDASSKTGAVGGSRIMLSSGASALRLRAEGWLSRVEVDGDEGMDSLTLEMQRLRLAVEWSQVHQLPGGQEVNFLLEGGLRYGDGDGTEGTGMEVGGGLRFVSATQALTVEGHGRLLATGPSDYEEWGVRGLIQIDPQAVNRGLSLKIVPAWGQSASGVQELWEQGVSDRPDMSHARQRGRVNTRVEYGLGEFNGTPYGRFYLADGGARAFGTGMRYELTRVLDLRVEGTRTEGADGPARHGLAMRGRWVF